MEKLSAEFRSQFKHPEILDKIETDCARLEKLKRTSVYVPDLIPESYKTGLLPRLPMKMMLLTQNSLRRGIELADSMIRDTNHFSYTPVFTSARSLFELASLIFDAYDQMQGIHENWDMKRYLEFSEHLDNVILGWKSEEWHPGRDRPDDLALKAKNVLTIMQRIDKKYFPGYFGLYELLSEVAHPNYMGMMEAYSTIGEEFLKMNFVDSPTRFDTERIFIALNGAEGAIQMLADTVEKFEGLFVPFSRLAAKMIHEDGSEKALAEWNRPIR